jgi:hypothetical protein
LRAGALRAVALLAGDLARVPDVLDRGFDPVLPRVVPLPEVPVRPAIASYRIPFRHTGQSSHTGTDGRTPERA